MTMTNTHTHQHANYKELRAEFNRKTAPKIPHSWSIMAVAALLLLVSSCTLAHANEPINVNKLANAIYIAEGGAKTRHPYGILAKYKVTTPRQACINKIKSALKRWNGRGDFIAFLGKTYCPVGAFNDPTGLNRNWVKNVRYHYERGA